MKNELLNKLNKKDREEFLERRKEIISSGQSLGFGFLNYIIPFTAFLFIVTPLWFIAFEVNHPIVLSQCMKLLYLVGKVLLYAIIFGFIVDYFIICFKLMKINKIKREYFNIIPKRK